MALLRVLRIIALPGKISYQIICGDDIYIDGYIRGLKSSVPGIRERRWKRIKSLMLSAHNGFWIIKITLNFYRCGDDSYIDGYIVFMSSLSDIPMKASIPLNITEVRLRSFTLSFIKWCGKGSIAKDYTGLHT